MDYPSCLLPSENSHKLSELELAAHCVVRETASDIYSLIIPASNFDSEFILDNIIEKIVEPQHKDEIYEFSVFLYGIYSEEHVGIKVKNPAVTDWYEGRPVLSAKDIEFERRTAFPLYIKIDELKCEDGKFYYSDGSGERIMKYSVLVEHNPTNVNFWHCQVAVHDKNDFERLDRKSYKKGRYKRLAKHILENRLVKNAICAKEDAAALAYKI